jgi:1-deoxy-D-xylulose-5-phosphate reductoisomerase
MRQIIVLGSTGSIGRSTLSVLAENREKFTLKGLAAGENTRVLAEQIKAFAPEMVSVKNRETAETLQEQFPSQTIVYGDQGLMELVALEGVDTVVSAIIGTVALSATEESIRRNHRICLANKETLVAAGDLINRQMEQSKAEIIPIDSEQSAIFQSIGMNQKEFIRRIILTASGGPFFGKSKEEFSAITVKQALAHPTWSMGEKITIDSATLMNKALEIIETCYLFKLKPQQIDVVIHPQSIIHSMVEYVDSSIIAQLSLPDMRIPIIYSLSYPQRFDFTGQPITFGELKKLEFHEVDADAFSSIPMAFHVLKSGGNAGAVFNAANEVAVDHFLRGKINFLDIFNLVEKVLYNETFYPINCVEDVLTTIDDIKKKTEALIQKGAF